MITIGETLPDLGLETTDGHIDSAELKGAKLVLYFYPKASTPGCTQESKDFRDLQAQFEAAGATILGASRDDLKAQANFKTEQQLPFGLISDSDETLCRAFGVIKEKNMYGKKVMGIERSTFLIDANGVLRQEWRKVKVPGHAQEVLEATKAL